MTVEFPAVLKGLFEPYRYKIAHGGRGSAKSWSFARYLIARAAEKPVRILCCREVQKSIRDSVHKLMGDQIAAMGLSQHFDVQQAVIKGVNGSEIMFSGLSDQTADSIKSFEGCDIAWVEEGQGVSDRSWKILIPTIRKEGSEILVTLNPELDTDPTYVRFIERPPPGSLVVQMNYTENPWFPEVLEKERQHAEKTLSKAEYENVWLGKCMPAVTGAIYADEIGAAKDAGRVCVVPYDSSLKVHVVFDLGWNDKMTLICVQKHLSQLRVIEYIENSHKTLDHYSALLKGKKWNIAKLWLPHDGRNKDFKTGKSSQEILQEMGWKVDIVPMLSIEEGIRLARRQFHQVYFDKALTERLVECLKRYRRGVPTTTGEPGAPIHDEWSHGADAYRYMHVIAPKLSNEDWGGKLTYRDMATA